MRLASASARILAVILSSSLAVVASARAGDVYTTTTFENLPGLTAPESIVNDAGPSRAFDIDGNRFNNSFDDTWGPYWDGWALSNQTTPLSTDPNLDFLNQYLAAPGSGAGGSANYAIAFSPESAYLTSYATIALAAGQSAYSIDVTNTLYTQQAVTQGDGWARAFAAGDFFQLAIEGLDASGAVIGSVLVTLADYRAANPLDWYVVDKWRTIDLTSLGSDARTLRFNFESTDLDRNGEARTPLVAAIDNLTTSAPGTGTAVPEPATWTMLGLGLAGIALHRGRRRAA
ncbi:DUF4465 domain-containing protein [Planctomyces sp. SH-PL62]|uniref:DUF4465 domain-containing protein n=1 Tax=Planctomyces sp. SH-PL62 TaxID=1636152 RepID=UPI00078EA65D|nr:DUF4465 domain-containing protein [Planctomyces sp. SH-PL62]AMV36094.1 PEP-CTERM motif protein [Planctomyces sp. SH-PL62]